jgi:hypothetical protein
MIAIDPDYALEDIEQINSYIRFKPNFNGRRDTVTHYGAGVERADNIGVYTREISIHSNCVPLTTTRVECYHIDTTIEDAVMALIIDNKLPADSIEYVYQVIYKETVNYNVNEYRPFYRLCIVWNQVNYGGKLPPTISIGRESRKLDMYV